MDTKTGEYVIDVFKAKHLDAQILDASELEDDKKTPNFVDLDITEKVVERVARRLSRSAGPQGSDAQSIQHWLLQLGAASQVLCFGLFVTNGPLVRALHLIVTATGVSWCAGQPMALPFCYAAKRE